MADTARRILAKAEDASCAIILPVDAIVAFHFQANAPSHAYGLDAIPGDGMILDVGPQSIERIKGAVDDAATLVWNGPLGAFEMPPFDQGTVTIARYAAERTKAAQARLGRRRRRHGRGAQRRARGRASSPMCRPPAARSSNGWRGASFPASRRCGRELFSCGMFLRTGVQPRSGLSPEHAVQLSRIRIW